jgi:hypothetical protein
MSQSNSDHENQWEVFEALLRTTYDEQAFSAEVREWKDRWRNARTRVPIELKLHLVDRFGREITYTHLWDAVDLGPGQKGIRVDTGYTGVDSEAMHAYVEAKLGI